MSEEKKQPSVFKKFLELDSYSYYERHLKILSAMFPKLAMTDNEISVLAGFMSIEDKVLSTFGTDARRAVKEKLELTSAGLSNYLKQLKDKKIILQTVEDNKINLTIKKQLYPNKKEQTYIFKLVNEGTITP